MEIIALQEYTDKYISLYEGEIRNVNKELADRLIEKGIVTEHTEDGTTKSDIMIVNIGVRTGETTYLMDHTGEEIIDWIDNGKIVRLVDSSAGVRTEFYLY